MNNDRPRTASEENPIAGETNPVSNPREIGGDLNELKESEKVLRQSFQRLSELLEAQRKQFRADASEREQILSANKVLSSRIGELELRIEILVREGESHKQERQELLNRLQEQSNAMEAMRKQIKEVDEASDRADFTAPQTRPPAPEVSVSGNEEREGVISKLHGQIDLLTNPLASEEKERQEVDLPMDQARENLRQAKRPPSHTTAAKPSTKARASFSEVRVPYASFILDLAKPGTGAISSKTTKTLQAMHRLLPHLVRGTDEGQVLSELCQQMGIVHSETARTGILPLHQVATALWMMFEDYRKTPSLMIPSSLRTVGQAMDLILLLTQKESTGRFPILCSTDVLAIDDDGDVLDILESQLGSLGMKTYSSRDPNLALPALQRQRFDLVLLDIGMAEQNGLELCAGIRKLEGYRRTPVVFLTGMTTGELREQATLVGGNDFVSKPFHATELGLKALFWAFKSRL